MNTSDFSFEFLDFWTSPLPGKTGGPDRVCFRDERGLPALDGDTVKGLFRDAVADLESLGPVPSGTTTRLFGSRDTGQAELAGMLRFSPARLGEGDAAIALGGDPSVLFRVIQQTSMKDGVAKPKSLRSIEWAVPCTLRMTVSGPLIPDGPMTGQAPADVSWGKVLEEASHLIRQVGAHRHRGYGRVVVRACPSHSEPSEVPEQFDPESNTDSIWLKVELLSRTLLGSSGRTVGHLESLDHIPGSALLGAAIGMGGFDVAFLKDVRVSPAYPLDETGRIAIPSPLCWSLVGLGDQQTILSRIDPSDTEPQGKPSALKGGFVHLVASDLQGNDVALHHSVRAYSPKSARDPDRFDRTMDGQFFALDRLEAGQRFAFVISGSEAKTVANRLMSRGIHLGRRRSSGNGRVRITRLHAAPRIPEPAPTSNRLLRVFVWSDLALYRNSLPTLEVRPEDFGLPAECKWMPERSALRTRTYAPWNQFHGGFESERHVISRGSLLTFEQPSGVSLNANLAETLWTGIGAFTHEGLGKLLLNPPFLALPRLSTKSTVPGDACLTSSETPLKPTTPWQRWLVHQATPKAAQELRGRVDAVARRLRALIHQQEAMHAPTPSASQFRSLAQQIETSKESALVDGIGRFCNPGAQDQGQRRSIRTSFWTRELVEDGVTTSLSQVVVEVASTYRDPCQVLSRALQILAAEAARNAGARRASKPATK